jgi:MFS family permease
MTEPSATSQPVPPTRFSGYNKRLLAMLAVGNMALFAVYAGLNGILIPSMVQTADPLHKVTALGLVTGISAIFATVLNPLGGAWSDRTRSRWGRRTPWLIGAAIATLLFSIFLGAQTTVLGILIGWCLAQGMGNIFQSAITAVVPDRVPLEKRGTASAVVGIGPMFGALIGLGIGSVFIHTPLIAGTLVGVLIVVAAFLFVFLAPDPQNYEQTPPKKISLRESIRSFFSSLAHHDFRYAFLGRLLLILGYFVVEGYYFYLLQDYIHIARYGIQPQNGVLILTGVSTVTSLITIVLGGIVSDKTGRRKVFVVAASIGMALVMLLPLAWPTWPCMIVFSALVGLAFGLYMAVDTALVTLVLPKAEDNARDMGILNIANAGPQIIAPFVAAGIITLLGGYHTLFIWGAIFAILGALAILPIASVK